MNAMRASSATGHSPWSKRFRDPSALMTHNAASILSSIRLPIDVHTISGRRGYSGIGRLKAQVVFTSETDGHSCWRPVDDAGEGGRASDCSARSVSSAPRSAVAALPTRNQARLPGSGFAR